MHFVKTCFICAFIQGCLALTLFTQILDEWLEILVIIDKDNFPLILAKFLTTITVHLFFYPFMMNALRMMKFVANHREEFDSPNVIFILCLAEASIYICCEFINLIVLFSKPSVFLVVNSFITQTCIIEFQSIYFNQVIAKDPTYKINQILTDGPRITWRESKNKWSERTTMSKVQRIFYKLFKSFTTIFVFYIGPNIYLVISQFRYQFEEIVY